MRACDRVLQRIRSVRVAVTIGIFAQAASPGLAAANWRIDPGRTHIAFAIEAIGYPRTHGEFRQFAGRISVNPALASDPSRFVVYSTSPLTTAGDTTRSDFLYTQLTSGLFTYSPQTGLGSRTSPLK